MTTDADTLRVVANQGFSSNTYLLASATPGRCVVVDPGLDSASLTLELDEAAWVPEAVLCTHGHFDHVGGAAELQSQHHIPVYLCAADVKAAKMSNFLMAAFKIEKRIKLPEFQLLEGEDPRLDCAGRSFLFHSAPGHTPGSAVIEVDDLLFSGDSLYARRVGLSQLPGEDSSTLRRSLRRLFTRVGGEVLVLPGHGGSAALKDIRENNRKLREFMTELD
jgi:glyoxylase-like metal-dependent hydrolase (beta-lactamase superfamily II)